MKKFELHLDALIVAVVAFALAITFLVYQRYQYRTLLQENVDLAWENSTLEANLVLMTAKIEACKSSSVSMEVSGVDSKSANPTD